MSKAIARKSHSEVVGNQYFGADDFQDDFGHVLVDDQITSALDDHALYNVGVGWVYYQFFSEPECGGPVQDMIYNTGYKAGECISLSARSSYILTLAEEGTCANLRVHWFKTTDCQPASFVVAAHLEDFTECHSYFGGMSYKGGCSAGEDLPIAVDSTLQR
jgi:hypothetical protein